MLLREYTKQIVSKSRTCEHTQKGTTFSQAHEQTSQSESEIEIEKVVLYLLCILDDSYV